MIEILSLDKKQYPTGFSAHLIKSEGNSLLNKSFRSSFYQMFLVKSGELILHIDNNQIDINADTKIAIGLNKTATTKGTISYIATNKSFDITKKKRGITNNCNR